MTQLNTQINDDIMEKFREIVYQKKGLRKGDLKASLEEAMLDYIKKNDVITHS